MRNLLFLFFILFTILACTDKKVKEKALKETLSKQKEIDSINSVRTKYNDSLRASFYKNKFPLITGNKKFSYYSDGFSMEGKISFQHTNNDRYKVKGEAKKGSNYIQIDGVIQVVSLEFLNFDGEIKEYIPNNGNGKLYTRSGEKTFHAKNKNKFWRLQDLVNKEGFIEYIDIHF